MAHAIRGRIVVLIVSVLLLTTSAVGGVPAEQQSVAQQSVSQTTAAGGTLSLNETSIDTASGDSFLMAVNYDATTGSDDTTVGGVQFTLEYDPTYLSATSISSGSYLKDNESTLLTPERSIDNTAGTVSYAAATTTNGTTGQGTVAYVRFETTSDAPNATAGAQSLTFSGVKVSDPETNSIPTETVSTDVNVNVRPQPEIAFSPASPEVNETVTLNASGSTDSDGTVTDYEWDTNSDESFDSTGETVQTSYSSSGTYNVSVRATDDDGATNTTTRTVNVGKKSVNLEITVNRTTIDTDETIRFNTSRQDSGNRVNATVTAGDGPPVSTGTDGSVTRQFNEAGTVTVTVSKAPTSTTTFNNDSIVITVEGNEPPVAAFSYQPDLPEVGETVVFNASESYDPDGEITQYSWDLNGNGEYNDGSGEVVNYTYKNASKNDIKLRVKDNSGSVNYTTRQTTIVHLSTGIQLEPVAAETEVNTTEVFKIVATDLDEGGVGGFNVLISLRNGSVANITSVSESVAEGAIKPTESVSANKSSATLEVLTTKRPTNSTTGRVVIGNLTVRGQSAGQTDIETNISLFTNATGVPYNISNNEDAELTVKAGPPPVGPFQTPPQDIDNDGVYEDINGGGFDKTDIITFYSQLNKNDVQDYPDAFNFNGYNGVSKADLIALYTELLRQ